jgi:hypothetical protein
MAPSSTTSHTLVKLIQKYPTAYLQNIDHDNWIVYHREPREGDDLLKLTVAICSETTLIEALAELQKLQCNPVPSGVRCYEQRT